MQGNRNPFIDHPDWVSCINWNQLLRYPDCYTSIGTEPEEGDQIQVYPNPARDFIQIPMVDVTGLTTIQIFDVAGKLVETQNYNTTAGTNLRVDVSQLEAGVYTFGLRYESGNVSNFNVVITK